MKKIETICHISDIHIRKVPTRNEEYEKVFKNLITSLKKEKPDRIIVVGDLVHDHLNLQGEQLLMAYNFLSSLSKIAPVRVTRGNHDIYKRNLNRVDSVEAIVKMLDDPNVIYYNKTGFYEDENIVWAVWHHGEHKNNPWATKEGKKIDKSLDNKMYIDLFHDPINGCKTVTGFDMVSHTYYKLKDFKGDYSMVGDIHLQQYLDEAKTKAYCGSLISQDVSEGDDNFHGYLLWDIKNRDVKEISIYNEHSFKNIKLSPYTDFDDLDFDIEEPTKYMKVRFVWNTLPQTRTKDAERSVIEYIKSKYDNITISHKNDFIEDEKIEIKENITLKNITDKNVQHEIFKEYLTKIGSDEKLIDDVLELDEEILKQIDIEAIADIEWNVIKFGVENFMSYESFDIDWRDMDGMFQINGKNTAGKTTIFKALSYIPFGKTLETENRVKYGDMRFVNNKNDAKYCNGYMVIEANGEYFGIKRRTDINRNKNGDINGAPSILSYYLLSAPDDQLDESTVIEKLDDGKRAETQKKIESIIGTYNNFMRIVMTTSDTLNRILSNDMAVFIDSLLNDSGLDVFDKKLEGLKAHQKKVNEKSRIVCDVEKKTDDNRQISEEIDIIGKEVSNIENTILVDIKKRIGVGQKYIEDKTKSLYKIDPETYNLNINDIDNEMINHKKSIDKYLNEEKLLNENILLLKETYDEKKLNDHLIKKENHKTDEYDFKLIIKELEQKKREEEHSIEIINGDIFRLKEEGVKYKSIITELKESKICPTCNQPLLPEHQHSITDKIKFNEIEMFNVADKIKTKQSIDIVNVNHNIEKIIIEINNNKSTIEKMSLEMEDILNEIGVLTNDKNDVEKRNNLQNVLNQIPVKIQNEELKFNLLKQKKDNYENSLKQIESNKKIETVITEGKERLKTLEDNMETEKNNVFMKKNNVSEKENVIINNTQLIKDFKSQEYRDSVIGLYKKCVHRDGIPRQMLSNYIIPKINLTLEKILSIAPFKIWLDEIDLRPKLIYNDRPKSIIDCISASGKERTFSSIVLKYALNQINVKAKPSIFLLDEVMGKLDDESVEEFIEILKLIKTNMKKLLIVEHNHEINSDYLINVESDDNGISTLQYL